MAKRAANELPATSLPWQLPAIEDAEIFAVQAIAAGDANAAQQQRFWSFLQRFCGAGRMSFWPGGEDGRRATDFAEGKRFVGDQLRRLSKLKPKTVNLRDEPPPMPAATSATDHGDDDVA